MINANLADLFEAVAAAVPERTALIADKAERSFAAVDRRSDQLAHHLREHGVRQGDHIALLLYNGPEYLEAVLALFKLRAVPINVNFRYRAAELSYVLKDASVRGVIHDPRFAGAIAEVMPSIPQAWRLEIGEPYERAVLASSVGATRTPRSGDDRYVLYTGGTTGMPKGVIWRHQDLYYGALCRRDRDGAPPGSIEELVEQARVAAPRRCLPAPPFMHATALWVALSALLAGETVVVSTEPSFDAGQLLDLVDRAEVNMLTVVGDAFVRPITECLAAGRAVPASLRWVFSSGALLAPSTKALFARLAPGVRVVDAYGSSETGSQGVLATGDDGPVLVVGEDTVVLGDDLVPVEAGSDRAGYVARSGPVPLAYHNDPEKSAATFPVLDGRRWAITGDRAIVAADGSILLLGRGSQCINTGGEKVYPEEVEAVLKSHPSVHDAVAVGVPDERWGQVVAAVVSGEDDDGHLGRTIIDHVRTHLAPYKAPRFVVVVGEVRRAPSGKADYVWAREVASAFHMKEAARG